MTNHQAGITRFIVVLACAASAAGQAAIAVAQETSTATFPAHVGRMYQAPTSLVWAEVLKVIEQAGLKTDVLSLDGRFLVTRPADVVAKRFGFQVNAVQANLRTGRVKLYVFVPPFIEPARVYVGSTLQAELSSRQPGSGAGMLVYNADLFGTWLLQKLSERLGLPGHAIPQDSVRRAALARSLLSDGDQKCLERIETGDKTKINWMAPRRLHGEQPVYPRSAELRQEERKVVVRAMIGEDGFAWPVEILSGAKAEDEFAITAFGAVSLWRFTPLRVDGCPAPMANMTTTVAFLLR